MAKDDIGEALTGILLGVIGGLALVEILKRLMGQKCPRCGNVLQPNQYYCLQCGQKVK